MPILQKNELIAMGRAHWREHLPKRYRRLERAGTLDQELAEAAERTLVEMADLEAQGLAPDGAWEKVRERYLIVNPKAPRPALGGLTNSMAAQILWGTRLMNLKQKDGQDE